MILEIAVLNIKKGQSIAFEKAMKEAQSIISCQKGFIDFNLKKCIENGNQYLLMVNWETIEDHELGFRKSADYLKWKTLLHHFYDPFPVVEHYINVN